MTVWKVRKTNKQFIVSGKHGFIFNNKYTAQQLCDLLNEYERKLHEKENENTSNDEVIRNLRELLISKEILLEDILKLKNSILQ